jgi:hypothetical protein
MRTKAAAVAVAIGILGVVGGLYATGAIGPAPCGGSYSIPGSIDRTGATDVSAQINAWIGSLPNGCPGGPYSVALLGDGAYRVDHTIAVRSRSWMDFEGSAKLDGSHARPYSGATWLFSGGSNLQLSDVSIVGNNPTPPPAGSRPPNEWDHNIEVEKATDVLVDHVHGFLASGDGIAIEGGPNGCNGSRPQRVTVSNSTFDRNGRMTISVDVGSYVTITNNTLGPSGFSLVDLESEFGPCSWGGIDHVAVVGNHFEWTSLIGIPNGGDCGPQHDITIQGNIWDQAPRLTDRALVSVETPAGCATRSAYHIADNFFLDPARQDSGVATLYLRGLSNSDISGNRERGGTGRSYAIALKNATGIVISSNSWAGRPLLVRNDGGATWTASGNTCGGGVVLAHAC